MPKGKQNNSKVRVSSLKHKDKRLDIPTEELRDFVEQEETSTETGWCKGLTALEVPLLDFPGAAVTIRS
jgi:hypothetical protein